MEAIATHIKAFSELSALELYRILELRSRVFVVEQHCIYADLDNKDVTCSHVWLTHQDKIAGVSRIVPPGVSYKEPSIGRVCIAPEYRATGLGKMLVRESIQACISQFGNLPIRIGAQLYLEKFYRDFGFETCSEPYDEDGILHIYMVKSAK